MENHYSVIRLALVLAIQAEIEGMKAFNSERLSNDMAIGYNYDHFQQKAEELRNLAYAHDEQLIL